MNRFLCLVLSGLLLVGLFCGCGKADDSAAADTEDTNAALEIQDDDTMHLNMLFSLISTPDSGVTELLGDGVDQKYDADGNLTERDFDGVAYGLSLTYTIYYNEYGDVTSIRVQFPQDVTEEQLRATVTELVGREPTDDVWQADTATITLKPDDDGLLLDLEQFEADIPEE